MATKYQNLNTLSSVLGVSHCPSPALPCAQSPTGETPSHADQTPQLLTAFAPWESDACAGQVGDTVPDAPMTRPLLTRPMRK